MNYSIFISNHPDAGLQLQTEEASKSWVLQYDGPIATPAEAREACEALSKWAKHVRCFRGKTLGKPWYSVLRPGR